jgi:hypothetical protein
MLCALIILLSKLTLTALQGEKFSDTKQRLEKRTGIKGKAFEKIKFAVVKRATYSKPIYLNDGRSLIHTDVKLMYG